MRADGRKNGTAGERRTNGSGAVKGWFLCLGGGRFLALGRALGRRRRSFDMHRSLNDRGRFGLAVRLGSGLLATSFAARFVPFRPGGIPFFYFRDGGGRGGAAMFGCGSRRLGDIVAIMAAKLDRRLFVHGAGVRLFFGDAEFREQVQYLVGLDFQLPRQLVNSDLSHR